MRFDRFDKLHLAAIAAVLLVLGVMLAGFAGAGTGSRDDLHDASLRRAMQEKAKSAFLLDSYRPVEILIERGKLPEALLRLQDFEKEFPGEPHTDILRGSILVAQGVLGEGVSHYAAAVRSNGDYVDARSDLNRRGEIMNLVDRALPHFRSGLQTEPNPGLERSLREVYYLQSRLAGGCE